MKYSRKMITILLLWACNAWLGAQPIGGVYEGIIGSRDGLAPIHYWQQYGFTIQSMGQLSAEQAKALYGHASPLRSIRLGHGSADHGLIRIMVWEKPRGDGLGIRPMKVVGNRWTAQLTHDILQVMNHAEEAKSMGHPLLAVSPQWATIYSSQEGGHPFTDRLLGVREMLLIQPLSRQIFFQRFNYDLPMYGQVNDQSHFQTSQVTHFGLVVQDDKGDILKFYDEVLGLLRVREGESTYEKAKASRLIFDLKPGESYISTDFDDPRSSRTELKAMRSGRLKVIRFPESVVLPDMRTQSRPGSLGLSLYTYRVENLASYHERVSKSDATRITAILNNEFSEPSFSFMAPDGIFWTLIQR